MVAQILKGIIDGYYVLFDKWGDPRSKDLPLIGSPIPGIILLILYLRFVNKWGPDFMKNREPFNLDRILIVYNAFNVAVSIWLFYEAYVLAWGNNYSFRCQPVDTSNDPTAIRILHMCYVYFMMKILELADTVFFILRKKFNQASYLHIYHHTGMVALSWGGVKYLPGGHGTFLGFFNVFVHIVMYSYYLITALYPQYKNNIWWKKHITQLQMVQFAAIIIHALQVLYIDCGYPKWTVPIVVSQNLYMFILFADFYRRAYLRPAKLQKEKNGNGVHKVNGNGCNGKPITNGNGHTKHS